MRLTVLVVLAAGSLALMAQETKIKPVGAQPTSPASGKEMYLSYCASCHGVAGKGNGPAAPALKKQPTDLTTLAKQSSGKYPALQVMNSIKDGTETGHGSKDMPVWGPILSTLSGASQGVVTQRVSNLVNYIETLQVK